MCAEWQRAFLRSFSNCSQNILECFFLRFLFYVSFVSYCLSLPFILVFHYLYYIPSSSLLSIFSLAHYVFRLSFCFHPPLSTPELFRSGTHKNRI